VGEPRGVAWAGCFERLPLSGRTPDTNVMSSHEERPESQYKGWSFALGIVSGLRATRTSGGRQTYCQPASYVSPTARSVRTGSSDFTADPFSDARDGVSDHWKFSTSIRLAFRSP
jgi:hypothetical protein